MSFASFAFGQTANQYLFSAASGTYTPLTGGTTMALTSGNTDYGMFANIPIGFSFKFNDSTYTHVHASTNGWMTFGRFSGDNVTSDAETITI